MLKCELEPGRLTENGQRYAVYFEGELLIKSTRDPEYAACRALRDLGYTGKVGFFTRGSTKLRGFIGCLVSGAGLCTSEARNGTLQVRKFVPYEGPDG